MTSSLQTYRAPWWLPGGHLQTIWPPLVSRRFDGAAPAYRRERWPTPDGDFVHVDWLDAKPPAPLLVLFHGQNASPEPSRQVVERLAAALAARGVPAHGQLRVLPQMTPTDFRRTLLALDVVVDPPHWSGGNTALDALAMGVPVVTMPGEKPLLNGA